MSQHLIVITSFDEASAVQLTRKLLFEENSACDAVSVLRLWKSVNIKYYIYIYMISEALKYMSQITLKRN